MLNKDLRKLSKTELLELLVKQARENVELRARLDAAEAELAQRRLNMAQSGSIAEAALKISGVFEAAQKAVDLYRENVEKECEEIRAKARREAEDPGQSERKEEPGE